MEKAKKGTGVTFTRDTALPGVTEEHQEPGTIPWSSWSMGFGNQPHCSKRARTEPQKGPAPPEARGSAELRAKPPPSDTHPPFHLARLTSQSFCCPMPPGKIPLAPQKKPDSTRREN